MSIYFKPMDKQFEWEWIFERARPMWMRDSQGIVAINDKAEIQAICVFDSFTPDACNTHFAIDNPMVIRRGFFHAVADHIFNTCGKKRFLPHVLKM